MRRVNCWWLPAAMLIMSACGSTSSPTSPSTTVTTNVAPSPTAATGTVTALINDVPFAATTVQISRTNGIFVISAGEFSSTTATVLAFGIAGTSSGTYVIPGTGLQGGNNALIQTAIPSGPTASWTAGATQGSGTVTITSFTANGASGTFSFTLQPSAVFGPAGVGTKTVTSGTFNVTF